MDHPRRILSGCPILSAAPEAILSTVPTPRHSHFLALLPLVTALFGLAACGSRNETASPSQKAGAAQAKATRYVCPMHPQQASDRPGDCAVCGMKLVPAEKEAGAKVEGAGGSAPKGQAPQGLAPIHVSGDTRKQMGLTFAKVEKRPVRREIRTPARILADQSRVYRMNCPADGWIDKLWVNGVGEYLKKGDSILDLYTADGLYLFRQTLNLAARESTPEIVHARLRRWGLSDAQADKILAPNAKLQEVMHLIAPSDGFVSEKTVYLGQKIVTGDPLIVIADLSRVWAEIDIFESDIPWVKPGMSATITFPYWPKKEFRGKVTVLNPFLDKETRTLRARLEVSNASFDLKPEMFGTAHLSVSLGERLVVPDGAVMRTGERDYAFRVGEGDRIDPVSVKLGARTEGAWEVLSGLEAGDEVVASANFLVDSESALKAAMQAVSGK